MNVFHGRWITASCSTEVDELSVGFEKDVSIETKLLKGDERFRDRVQESSISVIKLREDVLNEL